jgi:hypothetical protein
MDGWLVFEEACDPCESATYAGAIYGSTLCDFVFPQWYNPAYGGQVDYLNQITQPLRLLSGGYASLDHIVQASGWQRTFAALVKRLASTIKREPKSIQTVEMRLRKPAQDGSVAAPAS